MAKTHFKESYQASFDKNREKIWDKKRSRVRLHQSFKRSYREDYTRELEVPGLLHHAVSTFKIIFKNWKIFLGLVLFVVLLNMLLVGLMSEDTYVQFQEILDETNSNLANGGLGNFAKAGLLLASTITSGGLSQSMGEAQQIFAIFILLIIWLVTIYLLRHILAGHKIKLRDGLYNALTPLISTLLILTVVFIHIIPILLVIIVYSTAVSTEFLSMPFYALVFFVFAAAMILLSVYLLSYSMVALIAVTAPGMYPANALKTASNLMQGRRIRFIIRLVFGLLVVIFIFAIVMIPVILLDMLLKGWLEWLEGVPFIPFMLSLTTCFAVVYFTAYIYLFYRRMLGYDHEN